LKIVEPIELNYKQKKEYFALGNNDYAEKLVYNLSVDFGIYLKNLTEQMR